MMEPFWSYTVIISWFGGMLLTILSNASLVIGKTNYERVGWRKYRMGYSIKEIKEVIKTGVEVEVEKKLLRKIMYRRACWSLFFLAIFIIITKG